MTLFAPHPDTWQLGAIANPRSRQIEAHTSFHRSPLASTTRGNDTCPSRLRHSSREVHHVSLQVARSARKARVCSESPSLHSPSGKWRSPEVKRTEEDINVHTGRKQVGRNGMGRVGWDTKEWKGMGGDGRG